MEKTSRAGDLAFVLAIAAIFLWLVGWVCFSWPGVLDDAMIHLRYADNLRRYGAITYDGIHVTFGTSSLLYVGLLAALGAVWHSPNLPRTVSTVVHLTLAGGIGFLLLRKRARLDGSTRLLGLLLLALLAVPSAVRWLDDGMETGLVLLCVALLAYVSWVDGQKETSLRADLARALLGFFCVLLRVELLALVGIAVLVVTVDRQGRRNKSKPFVRILISSSSLLLGGLIACVSVFAKMHKLLPDTAVAKSLGIAGWHGSLSNSFMVIGSSLDFGAGLFGLWLLTIAAVVLDRRSTTAAVWVANAVFPVVVLLSALRGQQIQGVRYIVWTYFFSIVWNLLQLADAKTAARRSRALDRVAVGFGLVLLLALPVDAAIIRNILTQRARTMRKLQSENLTVLHDSFGVAGDIGFIAYFTQARICDLGGLTEGLRIARLTQAERTAACAAANPGFLFLNRGQRMSLTAIPDIDRWPVCMFYDIGNLKSRDRHYLFLRPERAEALCSAIAPGAHLYQFSADLE